MASKKEKTTKEVTEVKEVTEDSLELDSEEDKLDIEDIKDPLDEIDEPEEAAEPEVDLEEAVSEKEEPENSKVEEPASSDLSRAGSREVEKPKKEKGSWFSRKEKTKKEKPVKEKAKKVPTPSEDPLFVPKKKSILGKVVTVLLTVIITAAVVLGGVYAYTKYYKPAQVTNNSAQEETKAEESKEAAKYIWVNSAAGLNLRKEPSTMAEILAIIPNGTKLEVIEEDEGWYKVEYEEKEGWVSKEFVTEKNPLTYQNATYGFTLEFPETWSGYKIVEKTTDWGSFTAKTLYVALPFADKNWTQEEGVTKGYATLFAITPFTKTQWGQVEEVDKEKMTKVEESTKYVFTWSPGQAYPSNLATQYKQISSIIKTFELSE